MSDVNWGCCPLVAQTPIVRAFIEQQARERKAQSTIENYCRDLNDFLSAFPEIPFSELLEADENCIADYVDWLWKRDAHRGNGQRPDRSKITYLTGSKLAPATIRRRISALRSFYRWTIRLRHRRDLINPVREGAPQAQQIAERFHFLKNLRERLKEGMDRKQSDLPEGEEQASDAIPAKAQGLKSTSVHAIAETHWEPEKHYRTIPAYPSQRPAGISYNEFQKQVRRDKRAAC